MLSPKPWKADLILQLLLGLFVCMSAGTLLVLLVVPGGAKAEGDWKMAALLINGFCLQGGALILYRYFIRQHGLSWRAAFGSNPSRLGLVITLGFLAACTAVPTTWILGELSRMFVSLFFNTTAPIQQSVQVLKTTTSVPEQAYFAIMAIIFAPLTEEILFRGILYPFMKDAGYPRVALWSTALIFGLVHLNVATFVPLVVFAIILTSLYELTNNLLTPILAHMFFNGINFFWLIFEKEINRLAN